MPLTDACVATGISATALRKRYGERFRRFAGRTYVAVADVRAYIEETRKSRWHGDGWVDAVTACGILGKSRSWLDSLAARQKVRKRVEGWRVFYYKEDLVRIRKKNDGNRKIGGGYN